MTQFALASFLRNLPDQTDSNISVIMKYFKTIFPVMQPQSIKIKMNSRQHLSSCQIKQNIPGILQPCLLIAEAGGQDDQQHPGYCLVSAIVCGQ